MLRVLLSRRWLGALAAAAVFAVAAFYLGLWQWHRYEAKSARADRIESHYSAPAQPLRSVLGPEPLPLARDWTRVQGTGRYAGESPLLVRNRPWEGVYGYEVVVPLVLSSGQAVLVDRGWVRNAARAAALPDVPPTPSDEVTVTGWARQGEPSLGRNLPAGQLASINVAETQRQVGARLLEGYVVLEREVLADGSTPPRPRPLARPDTDLGPHQAYAVQWWLSMPVGLVLVCLGVRREARDGQGSGVGAPAPVEKSRKVRIWDEEDA